jgi:hypothetical protein
MFQKRWLAAVGAVAAATAAAQDNLFEIYPVAHPDASATTYSTRLGLGAAWGELAQQIPGTLFSRVADVSAGAASVSEIHAFRLRTQDQNAATQEHYKIVIRNGAFGLIEASPPFDTPFVAGGGVQAWTLTHARAAPRTVPNVGNWSMGVELGAAPRWPDDGQSVHAADYYSGARGDSPRGSAAAPAPNHCFQSVAAGAFAMAATGRVLRVGVMTHAPLLNLGNVTPGNDRLLPAGAPSFGAGGGYPDIADRDGVGRCDDLAFRIRAAQAPGGRAILLLGVARGGGVRFAGIRGTLDLAAPAVLRTVPLDGAGDGLTALLLGAGCPNPLRAGLVGLDIHFQALIDDRAGNYALTNVATVRF